MRRNREGGKEDAGLVLEHDRDNIVAHVPFPLELLQIVGVVWQQRGHVEHDVVPVKLGEDRLFARDLALLVTQTAAVARPALELDPIANDAEELVKLG